MPIQVQLPDGSIGEFPDGMPDAEIERVLQAQFGVPQSTQAQPDALARYVRAAGLTGGKADFSDVTARVDSTEKRMRPAANDSAFARMITGKPAKKGNAVTRTLGNLGGRQVMQGIGGLLGSFGGDALNYYALDPIDRVLGLDDNPNLRLGTGGRTYRQVASDMADQLGMVKPQTPTQRVVSDVGEALTGTGLTLGVGGLLNTGRSVASTAAPTAVQRLSDFLTVQPKLQAISTATGAGASSATREAGGGQGAQITAGLLGGLSPGAVSALGGATTRVLVRGTNGDQMRRTIRDFAEVGAQPSVGQASGNRLVQGAENLLAGGPISAGVMNRFAEQQAADIGAGLQAQSASLARNASGERAGRAIERGIHGPGGFTARYKQTQEQLFDQLDKYIPGDSRVDVSKTMGTLGQVNATIPGAPNVSKLFQNARVAGIGQALERDLAIPTPQQASLDEALGKLDQLYASRDAAVQDMGKFRAFANDQANRTDNWYPVEGLPRIAGRYSPFPQRAAEGMEAAGEAGQAAMGSVSRAKAIESTLDELRTAAEATQGRLPYEAIKKLRTLVGQELQDAGLMSDFPRSKFKALYASLSADLESAAREAGPKAYQAFKRANNYTRAGMSRVEAIERVIDKNGGPEAVYNAAMSGTRDGGTTLRAVMQSLPKEGQLAVTAAVIKRMGLATPGAQDAAGDVFSAATFLTNWNRVSPEARRALFDRHGLGFSRDMDRIARVADNIKQGAKIYANPSGTANRAAAITYGASLVASMFDPSFVSTGGLVASGALANGLARKLTDPDVVRWLARATDAPIGSALAQAQSLRQIGERKKDDEIVALADGLARQHAENEQRNPNRDAK